MRGAVGTRVRKRTSLLAGVSALAVLATLPAGAALAGPGLEWPGPVCSTGGKAPPAELAPAKNAIYRLGDSKKFAASFSGLRECSGPPRIVAFRKPDPTLDRALRAVARKHDVRVEIRESPVSAKEMLRILNAAMKRRHELVAEGARLTATWNEPEGMVFLVVRGNLAGAKKAWKDLDDLPYVAVVKYRRDLNYDGRV